MTKNDVLLFLEKHIHAVISTSGQDHLPEAALVGFGQTENLEIIFGTNQKSRKYKNIQENNRVAFVIGSGDDNRTVQYEGVATVIAKPDWEKYLKYYHVKVPSAISYKDDPDQQYILVKPTWIRASDFNLKENPVAEWSFSNDQ